MRVAIAAVGAFGLPIAGVVALQLRGARHEVPEPAVTHARLGSVVLDMRRVPRVFPILDSLDHTHLSRHAFSSHRGTDAVPDGGCACARAAALPFTLLAF